MKLWQLFSLPLAMGALQVSLSATPLAELPAGVEILTLDNGLRILLLPDPASPWWHVVPRSGWARTTRAGRSRV